MAKVVDFNVTDVEKLDEYFEAKIKPALQKLLA